MLACGACELHRRGNASKPDEALHLQGQVGLLGSLRLSQRGELSGRVLAVEAEAIVAVYRRAVERAQRDYLRYPQRWVAAGLRPIGRTQKGSCPLGGLLYGSPNSRDRFSCILGVHHRETSSATSAITQRSLNAAGAFRR
jgi:hypothetical protein